MSTPRLYLLAEKPSAVGERVAEAARRLWPNVCLVAIEQVKTAVDASPGSTAEVMVLIDPPADQSDAALAATDATGLPRWPVLVLEAARPADEFDRRSDSLSKEWDVPAIARAFRVALTEHATRRETARVRGDLKTLGHRLAHDMRAHLGGILSAAELMQELIAEGVSPQASHLRPLFDSTDGALKLVERISFVTRASAARPQPESLNMNGPFWAAWQRLESQIARRQASLTQPEHWPIVHGVADWLEVVWWNLLANALQHSGPAPKIAAGWEEAGSAHRFWVKDSGPGVELDRCGAIFHPLHRLHEPNAPKGLGLPIVQRLVELQRGRCGYERQAKGGSCFWFLLPAA